MPSAKHQEKLSDRIAEYTELVSTGSVAEVRAKLKGLHPAELAHLIESLPHTERDALWELVHPTDEGDILIRLNDDVRTRFIDAMSESELIAATKGLEIDDLVDILSDYPEEVIQRLLHSMDENYRLRLEAVMSYPEDTAGGLMNTDTITVRADISLDVVLRYLRLHGHIPETTDNLIVINREGHYLGTLALTDLLTKDPGMSVADIINREVEPIEANTSVKEVASLFEQLDLVSAPVVDQQNKLIGRITIDDVVDVIRGEAEHSLMSMAGLHDEEDMFAPVVVSSRRRTIWLGVNLLTALLASWVISYFDQAIEKIVALAILMPIVASMGGIAGSQTLTLVIRGLALGQVGRSNAWRLINKEILVGLLNGVVWAMIVSLISYLWFGNVELGVIIGAAMLVNLIVAGIAGAAIPILLQKVGVDPALAGGVLLTTVTDVIGFLAFLGLATVYLI